MLPLSRYRKRFCSAKYKTIGHKEELRDVKEKVRRKLIR